MAYTRKDAMKTLENNLFEQSVIDDLIKTDSEVSRYIQELDTGTIGNWKINQEKLCVKVFKKGLFRKLDIPMRYFDVLSHGYIQSEDK